jgi:hypothetical protein
MCAAERPLGNHELQGSNKSPPVKSRIAATLIIFALCLKSAVPFCDDNNDAQRDLRTTLQSKVLTLRHFYGGELLQFSANGILKNSAEDCAWTLCGQIQVDEVNLAVDKVQIIGRRVVFRYDDKKRC